MPERIYTSAEDGALEALEETPFSTEDELLDCVGGEVAGRLAGRYRCDAEQSSRESREVELDGK